MIHPLVEHAVSLVGATGVTVEAAGRIIGLRLPGHSGGHPQTRLYESTREWALYLGGPMPQGAYAWNKTVWVLVDGAQGPVLFRGRRVDGGGALRFSGSSADPLDQGVTPSGGVSETFHTSVIVHGEADAFYDYPAT